MQHQTDIEAAIQECMDSNDAELNTAAMELLLECRRALEEAKRVGIAILTLGLQLICNARKVPFTSTNKGSQIRVRVCVLGNCQHRAAHLVQA